MNNTIEMFSNGYSFPYPKRCNLTQSLALLSNKSDSGRARIANTEKNDGCYLENNRNYLVYKDAQDNIVWTSENVYLTRRQYFEDVIFFWGDYIYSLVEKTLVKLSVTDGSITFGETLTHPNPDYYHYGFVSFSFFNGGLKAIIAERENGQGTFGSHYILNIDSNTLSFQNEKTPIQFYISGRPMAVLGNGAFAVREINTANFTSGHLSDVGVPTYRLLVQMTLDNTFVNVPISLVPHPDIPLFHESVQISPTTLMTGALADGDNRQDAVTYQDSFYWNVESFNEWMINIIKYHMGYDCGTTT